MENDEARLEVAGQELLYRDAEGMERWRVELAEILMVAEYTSTAGAIGDDYFLEFGVVKDGEPQFFECVMPTGAEGVLAQLAETLGGRMRLKLFDEASFKSRVVWPAELEGQPLFAVKDERRSRRRWWFFGSKPQWVVNPRLVEWMKGRWDLSGMETGL